MVRPARRRALFQGQVLRLLAEIAAGRELDPPGAAAEINRIEVELEDLRFAQRVLDPRCHDHLADLAVIGEVLADQEVLHDLLGDGRAALRAPGLRKVADEGADQPALVDPSVAIEALVLGREERLLDVFRNVAERDPLPPLVLLEHLREAFALAVEHDAGARQLEALELVVIGQVGDRLVVVVDDLAEIDGRHRHLLVLAKLTVGRLQIGKIDAAKRLVLAGHRLRIVHRRGDELIEVDVLDVEGLAHVRAARAQQPCHLFLIAGAVELRLHRLTHHYLIHFHMGAARAQQPCHLFLIAGAIELRLHPVRCGGDLTERKRQGKDFDQERFHRTMRRARTKGETKPSPLNDRYKMAFWGAEFPLRINIVGDAGASAPHRPGSCRAPG